MLSASHVKKKSRNGGSCEDENAECESQAAGTGSERGRGEGDWADRDGEINGRKTANV